MCAAYGDSRRRQQSEFIAHASDFLCFWGSFLEGLGFDASVALLLVLCCSGSSGQRFIMQLLPLSASRKA